MAVILCIIAPASAITYCFDYVMYKVDGQDHNKLGYTELIDDITKDPYNYILIDTFKPTDSMKKVYWLSAMQKGDIIFLGTDHVGYATGPFGASGHNIDHYLQFPGPMMGKAVSVSNIEELALHDDLDYFISSHIGKIPDSVSIYRRQPAQKVQWSVNGHYYEAVLVPSGINWNNADAQAKAVGGHLVTLTSAAENNFVYGLVSADDIYWNAEDWGTGLGPWIGIYREGGHGDKWLWVTGEPVTYQNWAPSEPNSWQESVAALTGHTLQGMFLKGPTWDDIDATHVLKSYIIEWD